MPAWQRAAGECFGGPSEPLLAGLDREALSLLEAAAAPLERGLLRVTNPGRRSQTGGGSKKSEDGDADGTRDSWHANGKANGALESYGRPGARSKGGSGGAPGPWPPPPPATYLWACAVLSCLVLSVVVPTIAAVLVYKSWVLEVAEGGGVAGAQNPVGKGPSPTPPVTAQSAVEEKKEEVITEPSAGSEPWWEVLRKRRMATNAVQSPAVPHSSLPKPPQYECHRNNGEPCSAEEAKGGPPKHLIQPIVLSRADLALFRSVVRYKVQREEMARKVSKPTLAFLFLTRGPMPLAKLWERFFQGHKGLYTIYVHTAPNFHYEETDSELFKNAQIPSEEVHWGSPRMVDAERRLLAHALADPANQRFILLSESCVPLHSFDDVWDYLFSTELSFVESVFDPTPYGQGRYSPQMRPEIPPSQWRKGSQWWSMGRKHAYLMIEDRKVWNKIQIYCRGDMWHRHCYADEHYFPTLLHMRDPAGLANRSVTLSDWTARSWHPRIFGGDTDQKTIRYYRDMTVRTAAISIVDEGRDCRLEEGFERFCFLFLRKVEPSALPALLAMAGGLLGY